MSLQSYINNLRGKPEHEKRRFAFWSSFGFIAVVFAFWLASFTSNLSTSASVVANVTEKAGSPIDSLVAGVGGLFDDAVSYFIKPRVIEYDNLEVVPGDK